MDRRRTRRCAHLLLPDPDDWLRTIVQCLQIFPDLHIFHSDLACRCAQAGALRKADDKGIRIPVAIGAHIFVARQFGDFDRFDWRIVEDIVPDRSIGIWREKHPPHVILQGNHRGLDPPTPDKRQANSVFDNAVEFGGGPLKDHILRRLAHVVFLCDAITVGILQGQIFDLLVERVLIGAKAHSHKGVGVFRGPVRFVRVHIGKCPDIDGLKRIVRHVDLS